MIDILPAATRVATGQVTTKPSALPVFSQRIAFLMSAEHVPRPREAVLPWAGNAKIAQEWPISSDVAADAVAVHTLIKLRLKAARASSVTLHVLHILGQPPASNEVTLHVLDILDQPPASNSVTLHVLRTINLRLEAARTINVTVHVLHVLDQPPASNSVTLHVLRTTNLRLEAARTNNVTLHVLDQPPAPNKVALHVVLVSKRASPALHRSLRSHEPAAAAVPFDVVGVRSVDVLGNDAVALDVFEGVFIRLEVTVHGGSSLGGLLI